MDEMDDFRVLQATSTEVKNRYLTPGEILYAIDTGAYYVGGKDGKPQALISSSTSSDGGIGSTDPTTGLQTSMKTVVEKSGPYRLRGMGFGCSIMQQCNAYLNVTTSTVSGGDIKAGVNQITVANGALYTAGQMIAVPLYNARIWTTTISSIAGNVLTIADKTPGLIRNGSAVTSFTSGLVPSLNQGYGAFNAAIALLGGGVEVLPTYGYGGAIYQQMYADLERDLRYYRPHFVALHMFENDMTSNPASGASLAQMLGWARQCARLCLSYGATPIVYSSMPYYNGSVGVPASRAADYDALSDYVGSGTSGQLSKDVPGAIGDNSVSWAWTDPAYLNDPSFPRRPLPGWTDGVHPNTNKRFAVGLVALPVLKSILPAAGSLLDYVITPRETSAMAGNNGTVSMLQAGSVSPKGHTAAVYTANVTATTSKNADGSLKIAATWPGAASRSGDYIVDRYSYTIPTVWAGSTQRFRGFVRFRVNSMVGIAQIYPELQLYESGTARETFDGHTGLDMCESIPADGRTMILHTPVFAFGPLATSINVNFLIRPKDASSPSGALVDVDIVEMGIIPVTPEVPHGYV